MAEPRVDGSTVERWLALLRVLLVFVIVLPCAAALVLIPFFDWHINNPFTFVLWTAVDLVLVSFAFRRPGGVATWLLAAMFGLQAAGAAVLVDRYDGVALAWVAYDVIAAALVIATLVLARRTSRPATATNPSVFGN
ncbi:MAG TPA: hypothetical protein VGN51_19290 [Acidimicrobiia bacterium]